MSQVIAKRGFHAVLVAVEPRCTAQCAAIMGTICEIIAPFPHISPKIIYSVVIRGEASNRRSKFKIVHSKFLRVISSTLRRRPTRPPWVTVGHTTSKVWTGSFLDGQTNRSTPLKIAGKTKPHALWQASSSAFLFAEPITKITGFLPSDIHHRMIWPCVRRLIWQSQIPV